MKFLLTKELGRLAKWLRLLGYDTEYTGEHKASTLIIRALQEGRILITRNHRLPEARGVKALVIENEKIREQVLEVMKLLKIKPASAMMFRRCIICNTGLAPAAKERIKDRVPEYVFQTQEDFVTCPKCRRVYWQGTHWGNVRDTLNEIDKN